MALFKRRAKSQTAEDFASDVAAAEDSSLNALDNSELEVHDPELNLPTLTWEEAEEILLQADLGVATTNKIVQLAQDNYSGEVSERLQQALLAELTQPMSPEENAAVGDADIADAGVGDFAEVAGVATEASPAIWLVVGVNGVGKTTTVAKLAKAQKDQGHRVVLAAADTFRAAAIDQLQTWADRLDVSLVKGAPKGDPAAVVFDAVEHAKARGADLVIADTAGRMHTKDNLMEELQKILRVANKSQGTVSEILLVIDSTTGQNGISQARVFNESVRPTGIVLTKLDGSSKGGVVVSVQQELQLAVKFIGVGEGLSDLRQFDPAAFATTLLCGA